MTNENEPEGRTESEERANQRKIRRIFSRTLQDVAYGLRQGSSVTRDVAYGAKADVAYGRAQDASSTGDVSYGRQSATADETSIKARLREMLEEELKDLFGD